MEGSSICPLSVSPEVVHSSCPTCSSFYSNSFHFRNRDETRNGAERVAYMLPSTHGTSLSSHTFPDFYCNTHAISTDV
ncbi:protein FAM [Clarias magur]|uniref:Protein FAM n=1 Tax=Clarias magur TaxID=1594786 RepID=A0A8J4X2I7_CLAMG|nr:protein FAM [Clarias magur]